MAVAIGLAGMTARVRRALAAAAVGIVAGAIITCAAYALKPALVLDMATDREPAWPAVRGFLPPGYAGQVDFAWTMGQADLRLPGLDRRKAWRGILRLKSGRPDPQPDVTIIVDGIAVRTLPAPGEFEDIVFSVPPLPSGRRGLVVYFVTTPTMVFGGDAPQPVGVLVDRITLEPEGGWWPRVPLESVAPVAVAGGLFAATVVLLGLSGTVAMGSLTLLVWLLATFAASGTAPFVRYADRLLLLVLWVGGVSSAAAVGLGRVWPTRIDRTTQIAVLGSGAVLLVHLAVLLHPDVVIGDIGFHVHRLQAVQEGRYFFLSDAPGGQFPYPIALYVAALPFLELSRDPGTVLRVVVAVSTAVAGLSLYAAVRAVWRSDVAALAALLLVHAVPVDFQIQGRAFLTNAFGNAAAVMVLSLTVLLGARLRRWWWRLLVAGLVAVALVSHTSTAIILTATLGAVAAVLLWQSDAEVKRIGAAVAVVLVIGLTLSVAAFYGWFGEFYRERIAQLTSPARQPAAVTAPASAVRVPVQREEAHQTQWVPGWTPLRNRVAAVPRYAVKYLGGRRGSSPRRARSSSCDSAGAISSRWSQGPGWSRAWSSSHLVCSRPSTCATTWQAIRLWRCWARWRSTRYGTGEPRDASRPYSCSRGRRRRCVVLAVVDDTAWRLRLRH